MGRKRSINNAVAASEGANKKTKLWFASCPKVACLLAKKYDPSKNDAKGWLMSEKLDGVRAWYTGSGLYSRLGNKFPAPASFLEGLPKGVVLDGELFMGRNAFSSTISVVKTGGAEKWPKEMKYHVFDVPFLGHLPFKERYEWMLSNLKQYNNIVVVKHEVCKSHAHLEEETDRVIALKGEGVMLRDPSSKYIGKRDKSLLKHKRFFDAEAVLVSINKGEGRLTNMMGALVLKMACGKPFKVGSGFTDKQRRSPPNLGSIITYRFQELTKDGIPRFPTYVGVAIDKDKPSDVAVPAKTVKN